MAEIQLITSVQAVIGYVLVMDDCYRFILDKTLPK